MQKLSRAWATAALTAVIVCGMLGWFFMQAKALEPIGHVFVQGLAGQRSAQSLSFGHTHTKRCDVFFSKCVRIFDVSKSREPMTESYCDIMYRISVKDVFEKYGEFSFVTGKERGFWLARFREPTFKLRCSLISAQWFGPQRYQGGLSEYTNVSSVRLTDISHQNYKHRSWRKGASSFAIDHFGRSNQLHTKYDRPKRYIGAQLPFAGQSGYLVSFSHGVGCLAGIFDSIARQLYLSPNKQRTRQGDKECKARGDCHYYGSIRHRLLGYDVPRAVGIILLPLGLLLTFYGFIWAGRLFDRHRDRAVLLVAGTIVPTGALIATIGALALLG